MSAAIDRAVEAVLFAAEAPLTMAQIGAAVGEDGAVPAAIARVQALYAGRGVQLVERGGRWLFQTAPDLAHLLRRERAAPRRLSRAAIETLAIIAYHEPVSRADIEAIRGVQTARGTIDILLEAGWIRPAGRRAVPGRPLTFATTPAFLAHFGLATKADLPGIADLRAAGMLDPPDCGDAQGKVESGAKDD